jgi:thermitase
MNYVLKRLFLFVLIVLLAACSRGAKQPQAVASEVASVATVKIAADETETALADKYAAKVISFHPEAGFAILGFPAGALTSLAITTNTDVYKITALGNKAWASGKNAWGGGLKAWANGKNAWGGGLSNVPTLPGENRALWRELKLPQAHAISKNFGYGAKIAVIDTGLDLNHPAFTGSLAPSSEWKDFVDGDATPQETAGTFYGHGTAVAGIILQIAPRATILPLRVLDSDGAGDVDDVVAAIDWAVQKGVKLINLSLGSMDSVPSLDTIVSYAANLGVYVIASAGNSASSTLTYPAAQAAVGSTNSNNILSVGSSTIAGVRSSFSNYGATLEYLSFGENVYSAYPDNQVGYFTGTSFAAPQVTGSLALIMMDTAPANRSNLELLLKNGIWNIGGTGNGFGIPNTLNFTKQLPEFVAKQALLVLGNATTLSSADSRLRTRLSYIGYNVTVKDDDVVAATDATGKTVVVITDTVNPTVINSKLRSVTVPVVVLEPQLFDDMLMVSSSTNLGLQTSQTQVAITDSSHPLAAGYTGVQTVYTTSDSLAWGAPSSAAVKAVSINGNAARSAVFGYSQGASMAGLNAPARRVGMFLSATGPDKWASPGSMLFDAAVTWAVTGN